MASIRRGFQISIGLIGLSVVIILVFLIGIILQFFYTDIIGSEASVISAASVIIIGYIIIYFLDRSRKFQNKFQIRNINLKWFLIVPIAISPFAIGVLLHLIAVNFNITFNLALINQKQLALFLVKAIIFTIPGFFLYFSLKNLRHTKKIILPKIISFSAIAIMMLVFSGIALGYVNLVFLKASILKGTGYNDGPWLTWENDPTTSITVSWLTSEPNKTIVYYGTDPGDLTMEFKLNEMEYCHKAPLTGLEANTTYFYKIPEEFDTDHQSTIFNFTTAPVMEKPYKFIVFGDMQPPSATSTIMQTNEIVINGIIDRDPDFVLQVGDIADSGGDVEDWHLAFESLSLLGANVPIMAAIGNHDWAGMRGSLNWGELFSYPYESPGLGKYYSFDYLNSHFVVIDCFEQMYDITEGQKQWLKNDLSDAKTSGKDWIFCFFHLSMMTTATSGMYQDLQRELVPIFDRYGVDGVFFGHDHHYEHYNYTYGTNGLTYDKNHNWEHHPIQYFCTGAGGANLEISYGVLDQSVEVTATTWWNGTSQNYQEIGYERRPWNSSRYVEHPSFTTNYTQYTTGGEHDGKYYYHYPPFENYHDQATQLGFDYGEQAYHYIEVMIDGNQCNITTRYPNGEMMAGPGDISPQTWVFTK